MELFSAAEDVADHVAHHLALAGRSPSWLCCVTGIPRVTLDRRLSGRTPFTLNELDRIAEALSIPTASLLAPG